MAEQTEFPLEQFKELLSTFLENNFHTCPNFMDGLKEPQTEKGLVSHFKLYRDEVFDQLGGDPSLQDDIDELEDENEDLKYKIDDLESEIEALKFINGSSLNDEYKREFINQYYNEFTPWELEHILKNGRQFLNENPLP